MIIELKEETPKIQAKISWKYPIRHHTGIKFARPKPVMVEFKKILLPMPLLFFAGIFVGIGIILLKQG